MKSLIALIALVLISGCYKNNPDPNSPFNKQDPNNPQSPTGQVGFTKHAWCYAYDNGTRDIQERFMFNDGGAVNYREFAWRGGQRAEQTFQADGAWSLNGTVLQLDINGRRIVYQITYNVNDPLTHRERLHIYMNGQDATYDPCY